MSEPTTLDEAKIVENLKQVVDPEIQYNIYDLGLIYGVDIGEKNQVEVTMTLTSPACPFGPMIIHDVKEVVMSAGASDVQIDLVWQPPWGPERMSEEAKIDLGFDL